MKRIDTRKERGRPDTVCHLFRSPRLALQFLDLIERITGEDVHLKRINMNNYVVYRDAGDGKMVKA